MAQYQNWNTDLFGNGGKETIDCNKLTLGGNWEPTSGAIDISSSNPAIPITINGKIPQGPDGEILTGDVSAGGIIDVLGSINNIVPGFAAGETGVLGSISGIGSGATYEVVTVDASNNVTAVIVPTGGEGVNYEVGDNLQLVYGGVLDPPPICNVQVSSIVAPDLRGAGYEVKDYPLSGGTGGVLSVIAVSPLGAITASRIQAGGQGYTAASTVNIGTLVAPITRLATFVIGDTSGGGGGGGGVALSNTLPWTGKQPFSAGVIASNANPIELAGGATYEAASGPRPYFKNASIFDKIPGAPSPLQMISNEGLTSFSRMPIRNFNIGTETDSFNANTTDFTITDNYISFVRREAFENRTNTKNGDIYYDVTMRAVVSLSASRLAGGFVANETILQIPTAYNMLKLGNPETYEFTSTATQNQSGVSAEFLIVPLTINHLGAFTIRKSIPNRGSDTSISVSIEFSWNTAPHTGLQVLSYADFGEFDS